MEDKHLLEKKKLVYQKANGELEEKELTITKWGKKALTKAVETCRRLNIDYLWIDQFCINQENVKEKNQEVPKMRKYYNNAEVTLIAINAKVNDEIMNNESKKTFRSEEHTSELQSHLNL